MKFKKLFLLTGIMSMMLFSTAAFGYTYNVTQERRNSSYVVTKNGDVSSFMAMGTTGSGAYCKTSMNNTYGKKVQLTAKVRKVDCDGKIVAHKDIVDTVEKAQSVVTNNLSRSSGSTNYNYVHIGEAYTSTTAAYDTKADAYIYVAKQIP